MDIIQTFLSLKNKVKMKVAQHDCFSLKRQDAVL